jgi:predicted RNase H-like nuclease (RuvC/YqgF family)
VCVIRPREAGRVGRDDVTQIDQLKDEITAKDRALVAEHFDHEGAKKLKEQKEREVESLRKLLKQQDDVVAKQTSEMSELNSTIRRMDANALQQRQEYDQVCCGYRAGVVGCGVS